MNHLDMCSGIGGWAIAFRELGINTVAFCEIDKYPQKVLQKNFPDIPIFNDLKELTYEQIKERTRVDSIDLITCSYPCQPFSVAGKQKGEEDPRHLWPDTFRIVQECRPTWFVGENVSGHIKLGLDTVLEDLASEGYDTRTFVIPASSVGAWHKRERLWIIGYSEHNGSLATKKSRKHQETARGTSQGQNQAEQSQGASRPSNHENVSDTDSRMRGRGRTKRQSGAYPQWQFYSEEEEQTRQHIRSEVERCDVVSGETEDVSDTKSHSSHDRELGHSKETSSEKRKIRSKTRRNGSDDVSDTECEGLERRKWHDSRGGREVLPSVRHHRGEVGSEVGCSDGVSRETEDVSDTSSEGLQGLNAKSGINESQLGQSTDYDDARGQENWWQTQSELCGVPHGISYGLDKSRVGRIKGLGNAIVPQIAWFIGNAIVSAQNAQEDSGD